MVKNKPSYDKQPYSAEIHNQTFEREFTYKSTPVLIMDIKNFAVADTNPHVQNAINSNINYQTEKYFSYVFYNLYPDAVKDYIQRQENDTPFNLYGTSLTYNVAYNENCYLSTYRDKYVYTGGAHGTTTKYSDTYSLYTGKTVPLKHFFDSQTDYKKMIINEILQQADKMQQAEPGMLFEDYKELIVENFNPSSYYLSKDGIVIYYGQYEIAPYVSGIVEFTIPYSMVSNPPKCSKW